LRCFWFEALGLDTDPEQVMSLSEGRGRGEEVDGDRALIGRRILVIEVVEELLDAHRGRRREDALHDLPARDGVGGGVDIDGEGGESVLGRVDDGVESVALVGLCVGALIARSDAETGRGHCADGGGGTAIG